MPEIKVGLKIDGTPPVDQSLEHGLTVVHWITEDDEHHVYVQAEGFAESAEGAQAVAELMRDAADAIFAELGINDTQHPSGYVLQTAKPEDAVGKPPVQARPNVRAYQTPERVVANREKRAQARKDRKFRPHA